MIIVSRVRLGYLLFLPVLALLFALGGWQIKRGLEKSAIEQQQLSAAQSPPVEIDGKRNWSRLSYRKAALKGRWIVHKQLLLANRIYLGKRGFEVLTPFELAADKQWILVNRGWIEQEAGKKIASAGIPAVLPKGEIYLPQKGFTLGKSVVETSQWPREFLYFDMPALSAALDAQVAPAVLVLDADHAAGFQRIWSAAVIRPARHYAYAAQWWGLALTLIIFGLIWRRRAIT